MTASKPARSGARGAGWSCPPEVENWQTFVHIFPDGREIVLKAGKVEGDLVNFDLIVSLVGDEAKEPIARFWCEVNTVWMVAYSSVGAASERKEHAFIGSQQDVLNVCRAILDIPRQQYDQD